MDAEDEDVFELMRDRASSVRSNDRDRTKLFFPFPLDKKGKLKDLDATTRDGDDNNNQNDEETRFPKYPFIYNKTNAFDPVEALHNKIVLDNMYGEHPFCTIGPGVSTRTTDYLSSSN
jgi:hypothetical protein